jgi:hypothetical protein
MFAQWVLLPGASVLERFVARLRERVGARLWRRLGGNITESRLTHLAALPRVPDGPRNSPLDELRSGPVTISGLALMRSIERLRSMRRLGITIQHRLRATHSPPTCSPYVAIRPSCVNQNYLRDETLVAANAEQQSAADSRFFLRQLEVPGILQSRAQSPAARLSPGSLVSLRSRLVAGRRLVAQPALNTFMGAPR